MNVIVPNPHETPTLSVAEAAVLLGVSGRHLYRCLAAGTAPLPVIEIGGVVRVPTVAVRRLLLLEPHGVDTGLEVGA